MANSLEVRNPYLDYRLVSFAASLPERMKLKFLTTKYILKKTARGLIPDDIINRPKKGFGIPVAKWLKGDLKPLMLEMFSEEKLKKDGIFNYKFVGKLVSSHLSGKEDNRKLLWTLLVFQMWRKNNEYAKLWF
jgi:asparagine synthase (glutamine-hydrolysing)